MNIEIRKISDNLAEKIVKIDHQITHDETINRNEAYRLAEHLIDIVDELLTFSNGGDYKHEQLLRYVSNNISDNFKDKS